MATSEDNADIIEKYFGSLGLWQIFVIVILSVVEFLTAWNQLNIVFLAPPVNFICFDNETDKCSQNCTQRSFDKRVFTETIISQWDLVCQRVYLAGFAQASTMLGCLVGNVLFGHLADRFGRRPVIIGAVILQIITGIATAFVPWFTIFLVLRFLNAMAVGGNMVANFILVTEIVGSRWRATVGILYQIPYNLGQLTLPLFAYFLRDWRSLQIGISILPIILSFYYWVLPESPRWLLNSRKIDQTVAALTKIAIRKNMQSARVLEDVENHIRRKKFNKNERAGNVLDLIRAPIIRIYTVCLCLIWFCLDLCYFGISQYLGQLGGNIFANFVLSAIITMPSIPYTLWASNVWGRRRTLIVTNITAAISTISVAVLFHAPPWIRATLCGVDLCAITSSFVILFIYTGELYPTPLRNIGLGTCSMCSKIGSIVGSFLVLLVVVQDWIPPLLFGIPPLIATALCFKLPETAYCKLPDSIKEVEELTQKKKLLLDKVELST